MREPTIVSLGGISYAVKALTVNQVQRISRLKSGAAVDIPFEALKIALERAEPRAAIPGEIEATPREIYVAVEALFAANGFEAAKPGETPAPAMADGPSSTAS